MYKSRLQYLLVLAGTIFADGFLVWIGIQLLRHVYVLSPTGFFVLGICTCFAGLFVIVPPTKLKIIAGGSMFLLGIFYLLRATSVIATPILSNILGAASLLAAGILSYVVIVSQPRPSDNSTPGKDE
jgi:hypothetical protein